MPRAQQQNITEDAVQEAARQVLKQTNNQQVHGTHHKTMSHQKQPTK